MSKLALERTAAFFSQNVEALVEELRGREIVVQGASKKILITSLESWEKERVGKRYKAMEQMLPGDLWAPVIRRGIRQSLIVAQDNGMIGACVRLLRVRSFNPSTNEYVLMPREGDIAQILQLKPYERARLAFLDDSEVLYLIRGESFKSSVEKGNPLTPDQADSQLRRFLSN